MEQLSPQLMHKLVFTVLMHGLNDAQAGIAYRLLTDALEHPNQQIRELAVVALADLSVTPAKRVPALVIALKDENARVRRRAARALGDQGPASQTVLPQLTEGLKDLDASVRRDCAGSIGRLGPSAHPASSALIPMLGEPEHRTRAIVGVALRRIGRGALPALLEGAKSPSAELRARCVTLLGKIAPTEPEVTALLQLVLADVDFEVRARATEALQGTATPLPSAAGV